MPAPGVTFETVDLNRPRIAALRTDICGFMGYTERGPIDRAVKVQSWRQYVDAFGAVLAFGYTGHALRLFFDNGGDTAYVLRVVDPAAVGTAAVDIAGALTVSASYAAIDAPSTTATGPTARPASEPLASPGSWGNRLSVTVQASGLGATSSLPNQPADGATTRVEQIAGFEVGSWVRFIQEGDPAPTFARIEQIDPGLREFTWRHPIVGVAGLDPTSDMRLETVEFTLVVALDGQEVSRHRNVSLDPSHSRFADQLLAAESAVVSATTASGLVLDTPATWPQPGFAVQLGGGRDGLASIDKNHFLDALQQLAEVDDISVLAAPDLVLVANVAPEPLSPQLPFAPCKVPEAPPAGTVTGEVLDAETRGPVARARITSTDIQTGAELTDAVGAFTLTGLPIGQVGLRIERAGYDTLDASAQAFAIPVGTGQRFELSPQVLPPALTEDAVFEVQTAMARQGEQGLFRVALLDPPESMLAVEALQGWRSRFDTSHAAMYWPWLVTTSTGESARSVPPSGAVAGLIARMDRLEGPQRSPANRPFRNVEAVTHPVDDATHDLLNRQGINVTRVSPGRGIMPQGARTLSSDPEWRYLGVRRLVLMIAEAIEEAHQWVVFEPNTEPLRNALSHSLRAFLTALWRDGAFAGATPNGSFSVKCDAENNPADVVDVGHLIADIAVAPTRPYEYIRLRLGRTDRLVVQG